MFTQFSRCYGLPGEAPWLALFSSSPIAKYHGLVAKHLILVASIQDGHGSFPGKAYNFILLKINVPNKNRSSQTIKRPKRINNPKIKLSC